MSFERGRVKCSRMRLLNCPEYGVQELSNNSMQVRESLTETYGWVSPRHLLDTAISADKVEIGGYLRADLCYAERKIPKKLFDAAFRMEADAIMNAEGMPFLNNQRKAELREAIRERMLPDMPLVPAGIATVTDHKEKRLYCDAMTTSRIDALAAGIFKLTAGGSAIPETADVILLADHGIHYNQLPNFSFTKVCPAELLFGDCPGADFLTWLWFLSESEGGMFTFDGGKEGFAFMVDGPLRFTGAGEGTFTVDLRDGNPAISSEAKVALLSGKKLTKATLMIEYGGEQWTARFNAMTFAANIKLPRIEQFLDAESNFAERMNQVKTFWRCIDAALARFAAQRRDDSVWKAVTEKTSEWIKNRSSRV